MDIGNLKSIEDLEDIIENGLPEDVLAELTDTVVSFDFKGKDLFKEDRYIEGCIYKMVAICGYEYISDTTNGTPGVNSSESLWQAARALGRVSEILSKHLERYDLAIILKERQIRNYRKAGYDRQAKNEGHFLDVLRREAGKPATGNGKADAPSRENHYLVDERNADALVEDGEYLSAFKLYRVILGHVDEDSDMYSRLAGKINYCIDKDPIIRTALVVDRMRHQGRQPIHAKSL